MWVTGCLAIDVVFRDFRLCSKHGCEILLPAVVSQSYDNAIPPGLIVFSTPFLSEDVKIGVSHCDGWFAHSKKMTAWCCAVYCLRCSHVREKWSRYPVGPESINRQLRAINRCRQLKLSSHHSFHFNLLYNLTMHYFVSKREQFINLSDPSPRRWATMKMVACTRLSH